MRELWKLTRFDTVSGLLLREFFWLGVTALNAFLALDGRANEWAFVSFIAAAIALVGLGYTAGEWVGCRTLREALALFRQITVKE